MTSPDPTIALARALSSCPILEGVDAAPLRRLASHARLVDAEEGCLIVEGEDASTDVYFVLRGTVRVTVHTEGGVGTILGDFADGAFFGEMAAITAAARSAQIVAMTRANLARVPAAAFLDLIFTAPPACHRLLRLLSDRIRGANQRLLEYAALPSRLRLHAELLRQAKPRNDGVLVISPPPTGADLAARIGVRREAVSREMAGMARRGWVRATRGALILAKPRELREAVAAGMRGEDG